MKFATPALSAVILLSLGACSTVRTKPPEDNRSVIQLACQLPPPPLDQTLGATTRALIEAWQAIATCRAAALQ